MTHTPNWSVHGPRLAEALEECADDMEAAIKAEYAGTLHYPSQSRKFKRDMALVEKAHAALTALKEDQK